VKQGVKGAACVRCAHGKVQAGHAVALNRHQPDLFQSLVIKRSPIASHGESLRQSQYKNDNNVI
jgi:hypothetical protein